MACTLSRRQRTFREEVKSRKSKARDASIRVHAAYASLVEQKSHADAKKEIHYRRQRRDSGVARF